MPKQTVTRSKLYLLDVWNRFCVSPNDIAKELNATVTMYENDVKTRGLVLCSNPALVTRERSDKFYDITVRAIVRYAQKDK
jgi:hypothetical protein